jgi:mycothiol synthase
MIHRLSELPAERDLPPGFRLREAETGEAAALGQVLQEAFNLPWPADRVLAELLEDPNVPLTFLVEEEGRPVATASYQLKPEFDPDVAWLHWVAVLPAAQGQALGEIVSHRVLQEAVMRGNRAVMLSTDDFRLPAIRTYLRLGFEPEPCHESHPDRWKAVSLTLSGRP